MRAEDTYYIDRHGIHIWLSCGITPRIDDTILEIRKMLIADPGKVLVKDDVIIGKAVMVKDADIPKYTEVDEPPEEEPTEQSGDTEEVL